MKKQEEIVNQVMTALEKKNWEQVERNLTEDFTFSGAVPQPIDKKQWIKVHRALQTGIPDLKFNLQQVTAKGDNKVTAKVKLSGTHTVDMPPVLPGSSTIQATGKKVRLPEETIEFTVKGDKISNLHVKPIANGGIPGLLDQIENAEVSSPRM